jgi:hypothetical protein
MKYCTTTTLVKLTVTICSKGIQHNLVCIFRSYILFSVIFRSSRHFLKILFKSKGKKKNKSRRWVGILAQGLATFMDGSSWCYPGRTVEGGGATPRPSPRPEAACWTRRSECGTGSEGSPVAYAGKGGRCEYEGSASGASGKEKCATAHRGGRVRDGLRRSDSGG